MVKYENECCGCATENYPCIGDACPNRKVERWYCDHCKNEIDPEEVYDVYGEDLCEDCLRKQFRKR